MLDQLGSRTSASSTNSLAASTAAIEQDESLAAQHLRAAAQRDERSAAAAASACGHRAAHAPASIEVTSSEPAAPAPAGFSIGAPRPVRASGASRRRESRRAAARHRRSRGPRRAPRDPDRRARLLVGSKPSQPNGGANTATQACEHRTQRGDPFALAPRWSPHDVLRVSSSHHRRRHRGFGDAAQGVQVAADVARRKPTLRRQAIIRCAKSWHTPLRLPNTSQQRRRDLGAAGGIVEFARAPWPSARWPRRHAGIRHQAIAREIAEHALDAHVRRLAAKAHRLEPLGRSRARAL